MNSNEDDQQAAADVPAPSVPRCRGRKPICANLPVYLAAAAGDMTDTGMPRNVWFRIVNDRPKTGDQAPLRMLWKVAECARVNVNRLDLSVENLTDLIKKNRLHDNPEKYARQMLICLGRVLEDYPNLLKQSYEPVVDNRLHPVADCDTPDRMMAEKRAWIEKTPIKLENQPNPANALAVATIESYLASVGTVLAAVQLAGVRLDPTVDTAFIIQPIAVTKWLPVLKKYSASGTVRGHLAALLRIAGDLPNQVPAHITYLQARLTEVVGDLALDADQLTMLAGWTEPEKHACLLSAPDELMRVAENKSATFQTRMLAGASGFAFQLMWEHPGLSERAIAEFDTDVHIVGDLGSRAVLRLHPAFGVQPAAWIPEPMSPEAETLLDRLLESRESMSVTGTLLLPGIDGRPRETRAAMEVIYNKIQGVLSARLTSSDFRDINAYIALDNKEADLPEVAAALGYADARSLERRFGVHAQRSHGGATS